MSESNDYGYRINPGTPLNEKLMVELAQHVGSVFPDLNFALLTFSGDINQHVNTIYNAEGPIVVKALRTLADKLEEPNTPSASFDLMKAVEELCNDVIDEDLGSFAKQAKAKEILRHLI